jgi:adenosylhomocysteine nucleosidase
LDRIGVICGLRSEAACLNRLPVETRPPVRAAGASARRAAEHARALAAEGCLGLVSFGVAGGLIPGLPAGALVLPPAVIAPDGARFETDGGWRERVGQAVVRAVPIRIGDLAGTDRAAITGAAKTRLRETTGAVAADMESHAVARVAADLGLPFLAVRAVADPWHREVPPWVMTAIGADGRIRHGRILRQAARTPREVPLLVILGLENRRALRTLRRVASLAGPGLGF